MIIPVKKTVWGPVDSLETLRKHIAKSGQPFGVDWSGPACEFKPEYPCDQTMYQYMGWGLHRGVDIPVSDNTDIFAAHKSVVVKTSDSLTAGIGVVLESLDGQFRTVYWHLKEYFVKIGDTVEEGQRIATSNNTGYSKGPHLHFEYRIKNNGEFVSVDPIPYFENMKLNKKLVEMLQALEGYSDPEGVEYWSDKELEQYLATRLPDKIAQLQKALNG